MWIEYIVRGASEELVHCGRQTEDLIPRDHVALWHVEEVENPERADGSISVYRERPADAPTLYVVVDVCWGWDRREAHDRMLGARFIPLVYVIVEPSPETWSPHVP